MNKANTDKLNADFPRIFPDQFHFDCSDGWFDLIHKLCADITDECVKLGLTDANWTQAAQIYEKYGGLRFNVYGAPDSVYELISAAEARSMQTCACCGVPGVERDTDWIRVTCNVCEALLHKRK